MRVVLMGYGRLTDAESRAKCVKTWRRFRLDQVGHRASLEPGCSDSVGLHESSCGVVWIWLDQRVSIRVRGEQPYWVQQSGGSCVLVLSS